MSPFLTFIKRHKTRILKECPEPLEFCLALIGQAKLNGSAQKAAYLLRELARDARDYAISSAYALLIDGEQRKRLSAYFTPPALAAAATEAAENFLFQVKDPSILDPACGGGSFLVPIARILIATKLKNGASVKKACERTLLKLQGIEIDTGLAKLSRRLLKDMLYREYRFKAPAKFNVVKRADALTIKTNDRYDLIVGNPPYGKVGRTLGAKLLPSLGLANLGGHTNLYSLFLLQALAWLKPGGGLVFVLPTSFVAGPYFAGLRQEILSLAEVIRIDLHEQRENLFIDAVQDVCLLVLRRRSAKKPPANSREIYELGYIDSGGKHHALGIAEAHPNGEPWILPVQGRLGRIASHAFDSEGDKAFVLADYGYRVRVGKVVPTRERERIGSKPIEASLPLVWASDIRPDGTFVFGGGQRTKDSGWYNPPTVSDITYAIRSRAVLLQRTSNRDQARRLNAAAITPEFLQKYSKRGFVAENHVIILEVVAEPPVVSPETVAALLNSSPINERFSAVSGSFSVSAKLLARLALPDPNLLPEAASAEFGEAVSSALDRITSVLAPLQLPSNPQDTRDEPSYLSGGRPTNKESSLEGRALTTA